MKIFMAAVLLTCSALPCFAQPLRVWASNFEPFIYSDGETIKGFEYDILEYFAKAKGRELEVHFVDEFVHILPGIRAGEADLGAGTITITESRAETVDFSTSYFPVRVMVVEPKSRTSRSISDLSGLTMATMPATTYETILKSVPDVKLVYAVDEEDLIRLVASGEVDATVVDSVLSLIYLPKYEGLHMTLALTELQDYGFPVPKGSPLADELSEHIRQLKMSGIYYRLLEKYLGQEAVDIVKASKE